MRVVLIHDETHDVQAIRTALTSDGITLEASTSTAMVAGMTQQKSVGVVLVAVRSADDPKIKLVGTWRANGLYDGALVLLCPGRMAEDAYRLCREGIFDDYVFIEPLHDAFRLRLAVYRAQTNDVHERTQAELVKLSRVVATARSSGSAAASQLGEDWKDVLPRMRRMLDEWETGASGTGSDATASVDGAGLITSVERLQKRESDALASVGRHVEMIDESLARARFPDERLLLLVDDDQMFSDVFEAIVSSLGRRMVWTGEPRTALRLIKDLRPAVVFLDVEMPQMSGIEVLKAIRADADIGKMPVILMTGKRDIDTVLSAKALHVDGYLVKPPPVSEVAAKLEALLARR